VHARRAARCRLHLDVDAVEQIVERALVDRDARRVARALGQPEGGLVETLVKWFIRLLRGPRLAA
jgi:hypothetical protein